MSANDTGSVANTTTGMTTWSFSCQIPIQSYLIAIAVGDLVEAQVGEPTKMSGTYVKVITEPNYLKTVTDEFASLGDVM